MHGRVPAAEQLLVFVRNRLSREDFERFKAMLAPAPARGVARDQLQLLLPLVAGAGEALGGEALGTALAGGAELGAGALAAGGELVAGGAEGIGAAAGEAGAGALGEGAETLGALGEGAGEEGGGRLVWAEPYGGSEGGWSIREGGELTEPRSGGGGPPETPPEEEGGGGGGGGSAAEGSRGSTAGRQEGSRGGGGGFSGGSSSKKDDDDDDERSSGSGSSGSSPSPPRATSSTGSSSTSGSSSSGSSPQPKPAAPQQAQRPDSNTQGARIGAQWNREAAAAERSQNRGARDAWRVLCRPARARQAQDDVRRQHDSYPIRLTHALDLSHGRRHDEDEADWRLAQTRLPPRWRADENLRAGFIFARKFERRAR